ncbi:putative DNA-binding transcriptional regulator [Variovorax sp. PBS-H4]|uniref:TetR/AcrR family transcriptional regulator n=1 Tax=Variovorax sp. PBS-H4 TaxID=434008 RepID=UPI00131660BF|nr:TetR/AcrR family transcriptional regulator [Variovorax sp. PBS-H4]VTU22844.1 putative DNA-binding transcriptional regulator [Variovorax sp. PBS-H4]
MIKKVKRTTIPSASPVGREQVVAAVLDAASKLFAELPVEQVTTRALAEKAQVNLGLIHRHCGSKEDVLHAVMERYATTFRRDVLSAPDLASAFRLVLEDPTQAAFVRTLAFVTLSGTSLEKVISQAGALRETLRMAEQEDGGPIDESKIFMAWSVVLGWLLFKPFLLKASGMALSDEKISATITTELMEMLARRGTAATTSARRASRSGKGK